MNKSITNIILIFTLLLNIQAYSQKWGGEKNKAIWKLYSINVNAGGFSYFGDLSKYDKAPIDKLANESGPAFGVIVTKHFLNKFGVSGQIVQGWLKGGIDNQTFKSRIFEYNVHLRSDLVHLIYPHSPQRIGFSPYVGVGQFFFKNTTTYSNNDAITEVVDKNEVPEFYYFFGGGLAYKLTSTLAITGDMALRYCQNDKLDGLTKDNNYDYYSYSNLGLTYRINRILNEPLKNKARLAHDEPNLENKKKIRTKSKNSDDNLL